MVALLIYTNCDLKQHKCIIYCFGSQMRWIWLVWNVNISRATFHYRSLGENCFFCLFYIQWLSAFLGLFLPSIFKTSNSLSHIASLWCSLFCLLPQFIYGPCDYIGPTQIIQDNLISKSSEEQLKFSFDVSIQYNLMYSQDLGIRIWTSLGKPLFYLPSLWLFLCNWAQSV